jgi:hypothetical protein
MNKKSFENADFVVLVGVRIQNLSNVFSFLFLWWCLNLFDFVLLFYVVIYVAVIVTIVFITLTTIRTAHDIFIFNKTGSYIIPSFFCLELSVIGFW